MMFSWLKSKNRGFGESRTWLVANSLYQGFPIYFRRLDIRTSEYGQLAAQYPLRVAVTHHLAHVKENGLPEPDYNESLAEFDHSLIALFHEQDVGVAFLIETLAGKRTYYFYARPNFKDEQLKKFHTRFAGEEIEWVLKQDPTWALPQHYAADFSFE